MYSFLTKVSTKTNRIHHNFHKYKIKLLITGSVFNKVRLIVLFTVKHV